MPAAQNPSAVDSGAARYFRCERLAATLSIGQCRRNRERCAAIDALFLGLPPWPDADPLVCRECPQAPLVDAGQGRFFRAEEVAAGQALGEFPPPRRLPAERRESARPSDKHDFSSAFWVPEWEA